MSPQDVCSKKGRRIFNAAIQVGFCVEIHILHITLGREQVPNKIRPDKARTTGHKNLHAVSPFCSNLSVYNRCMVLFAVSRMSRWDPTTWGFVCSGFRDHV